MTEAELSNRLAAGFAGADADAFIEGDDEDFPVTDFTGACALDDGVDGRLDEVIVDGNLQSRLWTQVDLRHVPAIRFLVPLLLAAAHGVGDDGDLSHIGLEKRLLHRYELVGLDVSDDKFHANVLTHG